MSEVKWPISWQNVKDKLNEVGAPAPTKGSEIPTVVFEKTDPMDADSLIDDNNSLNLSEKFPLEIEQLANAVSSGSPFVHVTIIDKTYIETTPDDPTHDPDNPYRVQDQTTLDLILICTVITQGMDNNASTNTMTMLWGMDATARIAVISCLNSSDNNWVLNFSRLS